MRKLLLILVVLWAWSPRPAIAAEKVSQSLRAVAASKSDAVLVNGDIANDNIAENAQRITVSRQRDQRSDDDGLIPEMAMTGLSGRSFSHTANEAPVVAVPRQQLLLLYPRHYFW